MQAILTLLVLALAFQGCAKKDKDTPGTPPPTERTADSGVSDEPSDGGATDEPEGGGSAEGGGTDEPGDEGGGDGGTTGPASFSTGLYAGHVDVPSSGVRVAAEAYLYVVQGSELGSFPTMNVILKVELGGSGSSEYVSEEFDSVLYSYEQGTITLDDPAKNLVFNGKVEKVSGKNKLVGAVSIKNSAVSGTMELGFVAADDNGGGAGGDEPGDEGGDDEPGDEGGGDHGGHEGGHHLTGSSQLQHDHTPNPTPTPSPTPTNGSRGADVQPLPRLMGEYTGSCDGQEAVLQIETGRGVTDDEEEKYLASALAGYRIQGRLAWRDPACNGALCVVRHYKNGGYDFFKGELILRSDVADDQCQLRQGQLTCRVSIGSIRRSCRFTTTPEVGLPLQRFTRAHRVTPTADERRAVPDVAPPVKDEVVRTLSGTFKGFLHNERRDTYQPFQLDTVATFSSVNPHNNDVVYVSSTASIGFGSGASASRYVQRLDRKAFYVTQGFSLLGAEGDGFLIVQEWKKGFIRGIWVSHSFGKVGTVELVKDRMPPLPAGAKLAGDPTGAYIGVVNGLAWDVSILTLPQVQQSDMGTMRFQGTFRDREGLTRRMQIARGAFDVYTGNIAWVSDEDDERLITGIVEADNQLLLTWPGPGHWGTQIELGRGQSRFAPSPSAGGR